MAGLFSGRGKLIGAVALAVIAVVVAVVLVMILARGDGDPDDGRAAVSQPEDTTPAAEATPSLEGLPGLPWQEDGLSDLEQAVALSLEAILQADPDTAQTPVQSALAGG